MTSSLVNREKKASCARKPGTASLTMSQEREKRSEVWKYMRKEGNEVHCKFCTKKYPFVRTGSTSTWWRHVKIKHSDHIEAEPTQTLPSMLMYVLALLANNQETTSFVGSETKA